MNIYDTNESVELYDNRGIEMARKCIRRAKRECAFRYLILLLLFALGMVDKNTVSTDRNKAFKLHPSLCYMHVFYDGVSHFP